MAKLKNPLLSLGAIGRLAKDIVFARRRKVNIIEKTPIPYDAKSLAQLSWRHMYQKAVALWHALSASEKQEWESLARPKHMTGFAWFISQALKPNPGLYLPLQGGTMSGDIDMAKHRLLKLPLPTDPQEAARLVDLVGVSNFLALTDTPASYAGEALKVPRVNAAQNALEFASIVALSSKLIITTRDLAAPSGNVSHTGVGFPPTVILAQGAKNATSAMMVGISDSALGEHCLIRNILDESYAIQNWFLDYLDGGNRQRAILFSRDADGWTETWTKSGSPTGTLTLNYLCLR